MVYISTVICKGLIVDYNFPCAFGKIYFCLSAFSFTVAIISVRNLNRFLHFSEGILCLFKREELKLNLRVDGAVSDIVLVDSLPVLGKNSKVIEVCMAVEVHWHFVETELQSRRGRKFCQLFFSQLDAINLILSVVVRIEYFLNV